MTRRSVLVLSHMYTRADEPVYGRFVEQQVLALAAHDDMRVIAPVPWVPRIAAPLSPRMKSLAEAPAAEVQNGIAVARPRFLQLPNAWLLAQSGRLMWQGIRETVEAEHAREPVELIHAHVAVPDGAAAALAAATLRVPWTLTIHGADVDTTIRRSDALRRLVVQTCDAADVTMVVSTSLRDELVEAGAQPDGIAVVANGIDPDEMEGIRPAGELADGRWIVAVGNLIRRKAFDDLIRAVSFLAPAYADVRVAIVGDGPERARLEALVDELHLKGRVTFFGKQPPERTHRIIAAADVFVLPSWREAFGIVYLEAMALGRPVVACRGTGIGIPDVIEDGVTGLLVEARHPDGLAAAVRRLLDNAEQAREMGQRAREVALGRYTWEANAEAVHGIYESLLAGRS